MADKTVTIKDASDKELDEVLVRLRKEREAQMLVGDLIRNSKPREVDIYGNTDYSPPKVSTEMPIEELYHYGVLGMKWGVRRNRRNVKKAQAKASKKAGKTKAQKGSEDFEKAKALNAKGAKHLSNAELKELTTRMQLESQYKNLNPSKVKKGMKIVAGVATAGTTVSTLYGLSKSPLAKDVAKALSKKAG